MNVTFHYANIELYEYEYTSITLEKKHSEKTLTHICRIEGLSRLMTAVTEVVVCPLW